MNKIYTNALKKIFFICSCAFILMACKNETIKKNEIVSLKIKFKMSLNPNMINSYANNNNSYNNHYILMK